MFLEYWQIGLFILVAGGWAEWRNYQGRSNMTGDMVEELVERVTNEMQGEYEQALIKERHIGATKMLFDLYKHGLIDVNTETSTMVGKDGKTIQLPEATEEQRQKADEIFKAMMKI